MHLSAGLRVAAGYGITVDDVCYCQMPLFHGNALLACWGPALATHDVAEDDR